jgi:sec-independent protein translocase protein TatB
MLSIPHMIVVFIVVLVVFGPQKLPELARGLGKLMAEFRKASTDFKTAFEEEMRDLERQAREVERRKAEVAAAAASAASPTQPATQGTPPNVETQPPAGALAINNGDTRATEGTLPEPVVQPSTDSVPRSFDAPSEASEIKTENGALTTEVIKPQVTNADEQPIAANSPEAHHDRS